jgi:transcriptional regulator with XRE-family HTH domain
MADEKNAKPKRRNRAEYFRQWRRKNLEAQRAKDREKQRRLRRQDPEHYREYKRGWRKKNRPREEARLTQERQQRLEQRAADERAKLGRPPETLSEWLPTQSRFATEADLARAMGIRPAAVYRWRKGQREPLDRQRRKLFELTGLDCYADAADWKPREKSARNKWEAAPTEVVAQLEIRCGLRPRDLAKIRLSQIQDDGLHLANGRLIRFGDGWECVDQKAMQDWITRTAPADLLFFSFRPLDRARTAGYDFFKRALRRAKGTDTPGSRRFYVRHFAGDFARFRTDKDFVRHVQKDHRLANSSAWAMLYRLRWQYERLPKGTLARGRCQPEDAYDVLFLAKKRAGRPVSRRALFTTAKKLRSEGLSWTEIARRLDSAAYSQNPRAAGNAIRLGVERLPSK